MDYRPKHCGLLVCSLLLLGPVGCGARYSEEPPPIDAYRIEYRPGLSSTPPAEALINSLDEAARQAFSTIHEARVFEGNVIGIGGRPSEYVSALRILLRHDQASALFEELVESASMPGKLYGVCGLYFTDSQAFADAVESLADDPTPVLTQFGCMGGYTTAAELIRTPTEDRSMIDEGLTVAEWWERRGSSSAPTFDIAGGGLPLIFVGNDTRATRPPL